MKNYAFYDVPEFKDLKEFIDVIGDKYADKPSFMFERDGEEISVPYSQLRSDIYALGTYFLSLGIKNGQKIAVMGENSCCR